MPWKDQQGYIRDYIPRHRLSWRGGKVPLHRVIYEDAHDCSLLEWADVHHKDGNRSNNVWYNLQGMMHGRHASITNKKDLSNRTCSECGSNFTRIQYKGFYIGLSWHCIDNKFICAKCWDKKRYYDWKLKKLYEFIYIDGKNGSDLLNVP